MTPLSWAYMLVVWAAIIALNVFCFGRMFRNRAGQSEEQHKDKP